MACLERFAHFVSYLRGNCIFLCLVVGCLEKSPSVYFFLGLGLLHVNIPKIVHLRFGGLVGLCAFCLSLRPLDKVYRI